MAKFDDISTPLASRLSAGFLRIGTAVRSHAWEAAMAHGLTPTQADILALLAARDGALRLGLIAEQLAITPATASDAVNALVAKALVDKERAVDDGRAVALRLNAAGRKLVAAVAEGSAFLQDAVQALAPQEQAQLMHTMVKLIRTMQERGQIPVTRMCITCKYFDADRSPGSAKPHYCKLVGAPMGEQHLRLDCPEHDAADQEVASRNWRAFSV
jgi:DNA-binding MarR family transcriptional regulator